MIQIKAARSTATKNGRMRNIVDEDGEIIAKAADDHTLVGGHHRLAVRPASVKNCSGMIPANL
jgi:hypothetical protein